MPSTRTGGRATRPSSGRRSSCAFICSAETASARPARRRNPEIGADLAGEVEIDLAMARHGARALGVEAQKLWFPPSRRSRAPRRGRADGARDPGASRADDKLERLAVGGLSDAGMLAEGQLEDPAEGVDHVRPCLLARSPPGYARPGPQGSRRRSSRPRPARRRWSRAATRSWRQLSRARSDGLGRTRADENGANRRRPPLASSLRGPHTVGVQPARDLTKALALGVLVADSSDHLGRETNSAAGPRRRPPLSVSPSPSLDDKALDLADGYEADPPPCLDRLDERQDAADEGRAADTERLRRLRARVGEPLYSGRLADDRRRVSGRRSASALDWAAKVRTGRVTCELRMG